MKLIQIYDSANRIRQIDTLVENEEYSSRAEVYRTGALLLLMNHKVKDLIRKSQLDPMIFEKHIKKCLDAVNAKNNLVLLEELRYVINGLTFRELTSLLLGEEDDRMTFETMREGLQNYEKTLAVFEKLNVESKDVFYTQLSNDIKILTSYVDEQMRTIPSVMKGRIWHAVASSSSTFPTHVLSSMSIGTSVLDQSSVYVTNGRAIISKKPFSENEELTLWQ